MFRTLRSKLIFSYAAITVIMLVLVFGLTYVFASDYVRVAGFRNLDAERHVALPYVAVVVAEQRSLGLRPQIAGVIHDNIQAAGLRIMTLDPSTLKIEADSQRTSNSEGLSFPFPADASETLGSGGVVQGTAVLPGSNKRYQYIAQQIRPEQWRFFQRPGAAAPPAITQSIVVVAQLEPSVLDLLRNYGDFLLPALLIGLAVSMGVAFLLARSLSEPMSRLAGAAAAMARGEYNHRLPVHGRDELATLTEQFNIMSQEVGQAHQMQRDFVANISHDLKTPLTSIQGFSQAMLDGSIRDERQYRQAATIINNEAQRMGRLVSELLSLSQLQTGLQAMELRPVEIRPLLAQLALTMQPQVSAAGVQLSARFPQSSPIVMADQDRLKQAFGNLVDNALKHTPEGGTITIGLEIVAEGAEISITDTGKGIPAADLPRVMERFYQVDKSRTSAEMRSLGLGLAIAREIVAAHHGQIALESEEGQGTTVRVLLPAITADSKQAGKSTGRKWRGARTGALPAQASGNGHGTGPLTTLPDDPLRATAQRD